VFGVEDIVGAFVKIWQAKKFGEHLRLVFGIGFSYVTSGTFAMGASLLAGADYPRSFGAGLVAAATFATISYRSSPLARGTTVALPAGEAAEEFKQNAQVINK
jgi:hypothetical protein